MLKKLSFTILILSLFVACGRKGKKKDHTNLKLISGNISVSGNPHLNGGVIVYGEMGDQRVAVALDDNTEDLILPNGNWNFFIVAWDGTDGNDMTGTVRCDNTSVNLDGGNKDLNISLNQANCTASEFGGGTYMTGNLFKKLQLFSCTGYPSSYTPDATTCSESSVSGVLSYRVELMAYEGFGLQNKKVALNSGCISVTPNAAGSIASDFRLPVGGLIANLFAVEILTFDDNSCNNLLEIHQYNGGLRDTVGSSSELYSGTNNDLYLVAAPPAGPVGATTNYNTQTILASETLTATSYKAYVMMGYTKGSSEPSSTSYKIKVSKAAQLEKRRNINSSNYKIILGN